MAQLTIPVSRKVAARGFESLRAAAVSSQAWPEASSVSPIPGRSDSALAERRKVLPTLTRLAFAPTPQKKGRRKSLGELPSPSVVPLSALCSACGRPQASSSASVAMTLADGLFSHGPAQVPCMDQLPTLGSMPDLSPTSIGSPSAKSEIVRRWESGSRQPFCNRVACCECLPPMGSMDDDLLSPVSMISSSTTQESYPQEAVLAWAQYSKNPHLDFCRRVNAKDDLPEVSPTASNNQKPHLDSCSRVNARDQLPILGGDSQWDIGFSPCSTASPRPDDFCKDNRND